MQNHSGVLFPDSWTLLDCQLILFRFGNKLRDDPFWRPSRNWSHEPNPGPYTGQGRFEHLKKLAKKHHPDSFEWHDWSERQTKALCENQFVGFTGCSSSGKSSSSALYALYFFLCNPADSGVLCLSTSIDGSKRRFWREFSRYWWELKQIYGEEYFGLGEIMSPKPMLYHKEKGARKNDRDKVDHSHFAGVVAAGKGDEDACINILKGFHPKRLFVCADELDTLPKSVLAACRINLKIGTTEFGFAGLTNAKSRFGADGDFMEPEHGWDSLNKDTLQWTSKKDHACCLLFNGYYSPRVRDGDSKWSGLIKKSDIEDVVRLYQENSLYVWQMIIGLWPPDGVDNSVISEGLFIKFHARDSVIWRDSFTPCGLLDPAFGGDRCVWRRFDYGFDTNNKLKLKFHPPSVIPINPNDPENPAEYQIARHVERLNKENGIKPADFILDCTGTGRGVASVLQREYSPNILLCDYGGSASTLPVSDTLRKPCNEEYDRRVTELYFSFAEFLKADMVRGLDDDTCVEFSNRTFEIKGTGNGKRFSIETKAKFKERGFPSPDLSDVTSQAADLLKRRNIFPAFTGSFQLEAKSNWIKLVRHFDLDSQEVYSDAQ